MSNTPATRPLTWVLGTVLAAVMCGCGGGGIGGTGLLGNDSFTRRDVGRDYLSSPVYGVPRGREFKDIIPVGARIRAVHVVGAETVDGIWLTYERNGTLRDTPRRGRTDGRARTFKLKGDEKIIGIHGYGRASVDGLVIATNMRTKAFGSINVNEATWYDELSKDEKRRYVGVGIVGRADSMLRQISLRVQVRHKGLF